MTIMRTTEGINKMEASGKMDAQIGLVSALQRVFPRAVARPSRMSWLGPLGGLVQPSIGNI